VAHHCRHDARSDDRSQSSRNKTEFGLFPQEIHSDIENIPVSRCANTGDRVKIAPGPGRRDFENDPVEHSLPPPFVLLFETESRREFNESRSSVPTHSGESRLSSESGFGRERMFGCFLDGQFEK
jgi:hypothetical protein